MDFNMFKQLAAAYQDGGPDTSNSDLDAPTSLSAPNVSPANASTDTSSPMTSSGASYLGPDATTPGNHVVITPQGSMVSLPHSMLTSELQAKANASNSNPVQPAPNVVPDPESRIDAPGLNPAVGPNPVFQAVKNVGSQLLGGSTSPAGKALGLQPTGAIGQNPDGSYILAPTNTPNTPTKPVAPMGGAMKPPPPLPTPPPVQKAPSGGAPSGLNGFNNSPEAQNANLINTGLKEQNQVAAQTASDQSDANTTYQQKQLNEINRFNSLNDQDRQRMLESQAKTVAAAGALAAYADPDSPQSKQYASQLQATLPDTFERVMSGLSMLPGIFGRAFGAAGTISQAINNHSQGNTDMVMNMHKQMLDAVKQSSDIYNQAFNQAKDIGANDTQAHTKAMQDMTDAFHTQMEGISYKYGGKAAEAKYNIDSGKNKNEALTTYTKRKQDEAQTYASNAQAAKTVAETKMLGNKLPNAVFDADGNMGMAANEDHAKSYSEEAKPAQDLVTAVHNVQTLRQNPLTNRAALNGPAQFHLMSALEGMQKSGTLSQRTASLVEKASGDPGQLFSLLPGSNEDEKLAYIESEAKGALASAEHRHGVRWFNKAPPLNETDHK